MLSTSRSMSHNFSNKPSHTCRSKYHVALYPGLPALKGVGRAWCIFLHKPDMGLEQEGNSLHIFQPTVCLALSMTVWYSSPLAWCVWSVATSTFALFEPLGTLHTIYRSHLWCRSHEKKYQALPTFMISMFTFQIGGAWEWDWVSCSSFSTHCFDVHPADWSSLCSVGAAWTLASLSLP